MNIGQCEPGKALNQAEECQRCRAGRYSSDGTSCLDCPIGAICEMPCPVDEPCEGSVGTDWPLAKKGFWENMGPRMLIDGGEETNASIPWWDDQHLKQGVRTDTDDIDGTDVQRTTGRRRRLNKGIYHVLNDHLGGDHHHHKHNEQRNLKENLKQKELTDGEKIIKERKEKDLRQKNERLTITMLLRKRFFVEEIITRNSFNAADIDGSGFLEKARSRRSACDSYPKHVRRMLKLPMYINEEDGSQVWCRKICPGASPDDDASCDCDMCRYWERNEYTELAARYVHSTYFIPDPMYNTRKSKVRSSSGEEVDRSEIDIVYHTMKTNGPLTSTKTIYSEGMTGDPFNVCKGDTSVKCSSNQRCTNKNLEGGCTPHPSEASVHAMDLNKDNRISYEEFVESVNVNMKESFDIIDSDKDQFITVEELNAFISTMWNIIIDPEKKYALDQEISVTKEIFLTMDWDGSNSLDIAEYVFLLGNTDVYGESTQSKTFSAEELILLCRQSTDIMWNCRIRKYK